MHIQELAYIETRQAWQEEENDLIDYFHKMRLLNPSPILQEDDESIYENASEGH